MPVIYVGLIVTILTVCSTAITIYRILRSKTDLLRADKIWLSLSILCITATLIFTYLVHNAINHGMCSLYTPIDKLNPAYVQQLPQDDSRLLTKNIAQSLPKNTIVELYSFTCSDCVDINSDLKKWAHENKLRIIAVPAKSKLGTYLCKEYQVMYVPSLMTADKKGNVIWRTIYYNNVKGRAALKEDALETIKNTTKGDS